MQHSPCYVLASQLCLLQQIPYSRSNKCARWATSQSMASCELHLVQITPHYSMISTLLGTPSASLQCSDVCRFAITFFFYIPVDMTSRALLRFILEAKVSCFPLKARTLPRFFTCTFIRFPLLLHFNLRRYHNPSVMIKYGDKLRVGVLHGYSAPQAKFPDAFGDCIPYADPMWYFARTF